MKRDREKYNAYHREYQLRRYHKRMKEAHYILGGRCNNCGTTADLQIDHINYKEKAIPLNKLWGIAKHRFLEELKKCQLLCEDCHAEKNHTDIPDARNHRKL